ncbi:protein-tyrosine phosphatase protein, putative [Ichthyophthirius multifiliis]|uniref:Protein-tyrosine phosphatase protein, putative n=1 Tax=Ichthyophthirius multifiliis TaxID=5932 RepID=G0QQ37_ICHMU|nr:protein-tyrosine phosphatase protein, putative [Ichthyophthirius multifiliis]EGR32665.1 protein-tyrosine phosphatase protein, putative [Ichthyophthirius multifiliis]|eukprot:XP_004036651.1 protein-tyrosine phosphatase protein, putative [Ichthyophthirius multifiliis]
MNQNIVQGPWTQNQNMQDISYQWVQKIPDIQYIEKGIPIMCFAQDSATRNLAMEFRLIRKITETQYHNEKLKQFDSNLSKMNRYNTILPYTHTEVILKQDHDDNEECYINASYINSIFENEGEKRFIATQGPLPNTIANFWKMIYIFNTETIVMLCNLKENHKVQCEQYWPNQVGQTCQYQKFQITLNSEDIIYEKLHKRQLLISNNQLGEQKAVTQYQFIDWKDHGIPSETDFNIINFIVQFMIEEYEKNKISVIHCSAGVGRTGTIISLVNLMLNIKCYLPQIQETIKNKYNLNHCTISVFGIVRRLREQRWGMVNQPEQYEYIYKFIKIQIDKILKDYKFDIVFGLQMNQSLDIIKQDL